jgi:hypothetical protein
MKNKQPSRKLALSTEVLRQLSSSELSRVAAGAVATTTVITLEQSCLTDCSKN